MEQKGHHHPSIIVWDPKDNTVEEVDSHGPALSHYTGNVVKNTLVMVGGWGGKTDPIKVMLLIRRIRNGSVLISKDLTLHSVFLVTAPL